MSKNILFLMSGSIACYKSCDLVSKLIQKNHKLKVAMTTTATRFVGEATLEGLSANKVLTDEFEAGRKMDHIHLMNWADLIILNPASANTINSLASGLANNVIGSLFLAYDFKKDFIIFPAMNTKMYEHPATQTSLTKLKDWGIIVAPSPAGDLACGETGKGRLLETEDALSLLGDFL